VAYNSNSNEYVIVWEHEFNPDDHDIAYLRTDSEGTPGDRKWMSTLTGYEGQPAIAADDNGSYLVVWEDGRDAATQGIDLYFSLVPSGGATSNPVYLPIILSASP
jgi:hypothetical protein